MDITFYLYLLFAVTSKQQIWNKAYYCYGLVDSMGVCLALPIYTTYIITLGGTAFAVSLINSSTAFLSLISNPIIGSLSDLKGRRSLLVKCLLSATVGNILYAIAPTWHFVFLGKIIAVFGNSIGILQKAILGDLLKLENMKNEFFQKSMLMQGVIMVTMSGLSGYVSELKYGFNIIYFLTALAYILSIAIILTKLPDDIKNKDTENIALVRRSAQELKLVVVSLKNINWPVYWDIFAMKAGTDIGFYFFTTNLGIIMVQEFGVKGSKSGHFFMYTGILIILANALKMKLTKLYPTSNNYSTIIKCTMVLALTFLTISIIPSIYILYSITATLVGASSFLNSIFNEMLLARTTESDRGRLISIFENLALIAQFIASLTSGILSLVLNVRVLLGLAVIPVTITCLVAYGQLTNATLKLEDPKKTK